VRILWADDQIAVQETLSSLLDDLRPEIVHVRDGQEALDRLRREQFDLLILDLKMAPREWGGLWLLEQMHHARIEIATVVLSGEGTQAETIKALRTGASDYVTKDNAKEELQERVIEVLRKDGPAARLRRMLAAGENAGFECKETLRWNVHAGRFDKIPEYAVAKTIAAFANTRGGTLAIGVNDSGGIAGLEQDQFANRDLALLHFDNVVKNFLGNTVAPLLRAHFVAIDNKDVLRIDCLPSSDPVYLMPPLSKADAEFYVRRQASSVKLTFPEAVEYIRQHF
jgi:DNA-binding response OmpR family regulator